MAGTARRRRHSRSPLQSELHRLSQMLGDDLLLPGEVRDRAGDLHQSMTAARRQVKPAAGGVEHPQAGPVEGAVTLQRAPLESGVQVRVA